MPDIFGLIDHLSPSCISRNTSKVYKKWCDTVISYNLKRIYTPLHAVKFLQRLTVEGYNSTDKLIDKIYGLYSEYLPTDNDLARLSLLYQSVLGTQGVEEYSALTLWTCAIQSIMDNENKQPFLVRVQILVKSPTKVYLRLAILNNT